MRAFLLVIVAIVLAACAAPIPQTASKTKTKGHDVVSKGDDDDNATATDDDDDATTTADDDDDATTTGPNPVTGLASLPGSKIFKPSKLPAPAIIMLHGSEGGSEGSIQQFAQEMTSEGFLVLTLCWFDCKGLSSTINRIPIDQVINAGRWLKSTSDVNGKVGLFGWSRGAEMALIVGSKSNLDPFSVIAVHAPSDTVVAGFDPSREEQSPDFGDLLEKGPDGKQIPSPAWTFKGKALFGEPDPSFETPGPVIDVTAFKGPLYVSQGESDEVWPVTRGKHVVQERSAVSGLVTKSRFFPGEGHVLQKSADINSQRSDISALFHSSLD